MEDIDRAFLKSLQKFFLSAHSLHEETDDVIRDLKPHLDTLQNQREQLTTCKDVDVNATSLAEFPNLQALILNKITINIDECVSQFHSALLKLKENQRKVNKVHFSVLTSYKTLSQESSSAALTTGSPTCPSVSEMLEWMDDIDDAFYDDVITKEASLRRLDLANEHSVHNMVTQWSDTGQLTQCIKDVLFYIQYFMEEKL